jgi:tight adherence protein B
VIWGVTLLVFGSLLVAAAAFRGFLFGAKTQRLSAVQRRLGALNPVDPAAPLVAQSLFRDRSYSSIPLLDRMLKRLPRISDLQLLIHQAGNPCNMGVLVLSSGVLASLGILGGLLEKSYALGLGLLGLLLPVLWLKFLRKRRLAALDENFSEAVDLIARALRAGHSFGSGLKMAAEEMGEPMAGELSQTFEDYSFGKSMDDALADLAHRVGLQDVKFFATAVALQPHRNHGQHGPHYPPTLQHDAPGKGPVGRGAHQRHHPVHHGAGALGGVVVHQPRLPVLIVHPPHRQDPAYGGRRLPALRHPGH